MEYKDFIKLVKELREAQKVYFKATHGTIAKVEALKLSKKLEKQVDDAIRQFEGENAPDQAQQSLFG